MIMNILEKYNLKGVFFINIYEHKNFDKTIETIIKDIDERGHEVALHHHSNESSKWTKSLIEYDFNEQKESLKYGKEFIENITKKPCVSFRGGAYLVNENTLKALDELGFKYDSSAYALSKQNLVYKSINKISKYDNITEFPVTTAFLDNYITKIDINTQKNAQKMCDLMQTHRQNGLNHIVSMLHSFSFIKWYKGNEKEKQSPLKFTANRYAIGIDEKLISEFDKFCKMMSLNDEFECSTFANLSDDDIKEALKNDKDCLPKQMTKFSSLKFCPICKTYSNFNPYRNRENALCSNCKSLERMRFKFLYLERILNLSSTKCKNILHIGHAMCVYNELSKFSQHNYITSDPFSSSIYKYPLENIPFEDGYFDLIICIAILMHVLDDDKCLKEMARLLSKKGELILWLGSLDNDKTQERYDRSKFDLMKAVDFSYPNDLQAGKTIELEDGKIGYNPRFSTRTYGKDVLEKLKNFGLNYKLIYAKDFAGYKKYSLYENDILIIAYKGTQ